MAITTWVLLAATEHSPPLIDLDSTVFAQLLIFLVLLLALTQLVFRPYLRLRAERARSIEGVREEARELSRDAEHRVQSYEEQIAKTRKEAALVRLQLRQEGEASAAQLVAEARRRAEAELAAAGEKMERSTQAAELSLRTRADALARTAAGKLLGRQV